MAEIFHLFDRPQISMSATSPQPVLGETVSTPTAPTDVFVPRATGWWAAGSAKVRLRAPEGSDREQASSRYAADLFWSFHLSSHSYFHSCFSSFLAAVPGIESRLSRVPGKRSTSELRPQPFLFPLFPP